MNHHLTNIAFLSVISKESLHEFVDPQSFTFRFYNAFLFLFGSFLASCLQEIEI
jgi:hypothetical protein